MCLLVLNHRYVFWSANPISEAPLHQKVSHTSHFEGAIDLTIVNEEKLIQALIKRGVISAKATEAQKQKGLQAI